MSLETFGWLILAFPLAGSVLIALTFKLLPWKVHGWIGVFAIIVMVVAACEVCIGLGLVVAIYRRRLPIDVDEIRELHG